MNDDLILIQEEIMNKKPITFNVAITDESVKSITDNVNEIMTNEIGSKTIIKSIGLISMALCATACFKIYMESK